jgi:outer membrane protein OmpA-like peptidoglycan-associated protein
VERAVKKHTIGGSRPVVAWHGEEYPITQEPSEFDRNRRVEISIKELNP